MYDGLKKKSPDMRTTGGKARPTHGGRELDMEGMDQMDMGENVGIVEGLGDSMLLLIQDFELRKTTILMKEALRCLRMTSISLWTRQIRLPYQQQEQKLEERVLAGQSINL